MDHIGNGVIMNKKMNKKKNHNQLIVLSGHNEMIIFRRANEKKVMKIYFNNPEDRDIEDYDREEIIDPAVSISSCLRFG